MPYFAVVRERGAAWDWSKPMRRQDRWEAHAAFLEALVETGRIVAGGPLGAEDDAKRVLLIVDPQKPGGELAVDAMLRDDPWTQIQLLKTVSIQPWTVLLGGFRS